MVTIETLILGSTSPFRQQLFAKSGLTFIQRGAQIDERQIIHPSPRTEALMRAEAKAHDVAKQSSHALIIGADQVLEYNGRALGKVGSLDEAEARLSQLAGKTHYLHSAYALVVCDTHKQQTYVRNCVTIAMPMRKLTVQEIKSYLATDEWQNVVGAYQAENRGAHLFDDLQADTTAVIGLPMSPLLRDLRKIGIDGLLQPRPIWHIPTL